MIVIVLIIVLFQLLAFARVVKTPFGPYVLKNSTVANENFQNLFAGVDINFMTFSLHSDHHFQFKRLNHSISPIFLDNTQVVLLVAGGGSRLRDFHDLAHRLVERQILRFERQHQPNWMQSIEFKPTNWLFVAPILSAGDSTFADDASKLEQIGRLCTYVGQLYNQKKCHFIG